MLGTGWLAFGTFGSMRAVLEIARARDDAATAAAAARARHAAPFGALSRACGDELFLKLPPAALVELSFVHIDLVALGRLNDEIGADDVDVRVGTALRAYEAALARLMAADEPDASDAPAAAAAAAVAAAASARSTAAGAAAVRGHRAARPDDGAASARAREVGGRGDASATAPPGEVPRAPVGAAALQLDRIAPSLSEPPSLRNATDGDRYVADARGEHAADRAVAGAADDAAAAVDGAAAPRRAAVRRLCRAFCWCGGSELALLAGTRSAATQLRMLSAAFRHEGLAIRAAAAPFDGDDIAAAHGGARALGNTRAAHAATSAVRGAKRAERSRAAAARAYIEVSARRTGTDADAEMDAAADAAAVAAAATLPRLMWCPLGAAEPVIVPDDGAFVAALRAARDGVDGEERVTAAGAARGRAHGVAARAADNEARVNVAQESKEGPSAAADAVGAGSASAEGPGEQVDESAMLEVTVESGVGIVLANATSPSHLKLDVVDDGGAEDAVQRKIAAADGGVDGGGEHEGLLAAVEARVAAAEHPDEEQGYAAAAAAAAAAILGGGGTGTTESVPAPQDTGASSASLTSMARLFS